MAFLKKVTGPEPGLEWGLDGGLEGDLEFGPEAAAGSAGYGRVSFVEAKQLFRKVGEAVGLARREKYRAAWFERSVYHPEFAGDYGRLKLAERRGELLHRVVAAVIPTVMLTVLPKVLPKVLPNLAATVPPSVPPTVSQSVTPTVPPTVSPSVTPTVSQSVTAAVAPESEGGVVREAFALLDRRFGITQWCTLSDVAGYLVRGKVVEGLREEAWCCRRLPDGGTIFAYHEAVGRLGSRDAA